MKGRPNLTVTADDYGLTRGITDTILETVDRGPVSNVSIMANGEAFEYALKEQLLRAEKLKLSVHLNLTEGPTVAPSHEVPLLVGADGMFKYSVVGLWLAYMFTGNRDAFRAQVRRELEAQYRRVLSALGARGSIFSVNGHQHVHMLPFVQKALAEMPHMPPVRVPKEPLYAGNAGDLPALVLRFPGWLLLSLVSRAWRGPLFSDAFIGLIYSGRMTDTRVEAGLARVSETGAASVELLLHPGSANSGEIALWSRYAGYPWYFSAWRVRERDLLLDSTFQRMLAGGKYASRIPGTVLRFVISGSFAAAAQLTVTYALTEGVGLWYVASSVVGWVVGFAVSFTMQKFWTFGNSALDAAPRQAVRYFTLQGTNLILNTAGVYFLTEALGMWYLAAQFVVLILVAACTFVISKRFIFTARS